MKNRPIIGISGSHNETDSQLSIKETYIQAILNAGGLPILLPETGDSEIVEELLQHIDGLIIAGGGDVLPAYFGEEPLEACGKPDAQRDAFEMLITPMAIRRNMPVFGICRGVQVLAVALGGTLIQDIESQCALPRARHYQAMPYDHSVHRVILKKGGLFATVTGSQSIDTNSMHHQSIKDPGPNLEIEGTTEDGIVEAARMKGSERVFGVQFHPEYLCGKDPRIASIFTYFVNQTRLYQEEKA